MTTAAVVNPAIDPDVAAANYYIQNPIEFKKDYLKSPEFDIEQEKVFNELFRHRRTAVSTPHNFGKTNIIANAALTAINIFAPEVLIIVIAPTFRQIKAVTFGEIRKIFNETNKDVPVLGGEMFATTYKISDKWFILGFSPRKSNEGDPSVFQGFHGKTVIVIFEEATGINRALWEAAEGVLTGAGRVFWWAIANPTDAAAEFGKIFNSKSGFGWFKIKKTCFDTPNLRINGIKGIEDIRREGSKVRALSTDEEKEAYLSSYKVANPYLLSTRWVIEKFLTWGESSPLFQSKVLGEFAVHTKNNIVPLQRLEELMLGTFKDRDEKTGKDVEYWETEFHGFGKWDGKTDENIGVDCAREGDDLTVAFRLRGNRQDGPSKAWAKNYIRDAAGTKLQEDSKFVAGEIKKSMIFDPARVIPGITRRVRVLIDMTGGFGVGIYDYLRNDEDIKANRYIEIIGVNFAEAAQNENKYINRVSEMWIEAGADLMAPAGILLLPDDELKNELSSRLKDFSNKLKETIEPKKEFKIRIGHSPDRGDAFVLANAGRRGLTGAKKAGSFRDPNAKDYGRGINTSGDNW